MATKVYKSAMGRVVDMGALMLENENTRAVGNMKVNARGDKIDVANKVTETKNKQVQRSSRARARCVRACESVCVRERACSERRSSTRTTNDEPESQMMPVSNALSLALAPNPNPNQRTLTKC